MSVKIGVSGASVMAREGRDTFLRYLDALEELEWDSVWFSDRIVGPAWRMDPLAGMAITAGRTQKLKFGTGVLLMSMRSPVTVARELATIDLLSGGGRLVVGVGVGQESTLEYDAMGVAKRDRGKRLDEAIRLMRRLWSEDRITYESDFDENGIFYFLGTEGGASAYANPAKTEPPRVVATRWRRWMWNPSDGWRATRAERAWGT